MIPKISGFLSLATFVFVSAAVAAEPYLVKDVWPGTRPVSANPSFIANVGSSTYFSVLEPSRNQRLWKTDGTEAGTVPVPTLGFFSGQGAPFGSSFLAVALDANLGRQLWKTDGTAAGTTMLTSTSGVMLGAVAPDFSAAFFFVQSPRPTEVWRTDGTSSGNVKLGTFPATFGIGIAATTSSLVFIAGNRLRAIDTSGNLQVLATDATLMNLSERAGSTTVFEVWSGTSVQLWKTDGTAAGTVLLRDHFIDDGYVHGFERMGAFWYFLADDGVTGLELWRTDGTIGGTSLVADTTAGAAGTTFQGLAASGSTIYFLATSGNHDGLWRSDGTVAGTALVKDGIAGAQLLSGSGSNGAILFAYDDGIHGMEPWRSDGTPASTVLLRDINPGAASSMSSNASSITRTDGLTLFAASNGVNGEEPWITDGTAAGTRLLKDAGSDDANSSSPRAFAIVGNRLMFIADDSGGSAVWSSDGTDSGTRRAGPVKSEVGQATASGGLYYFTRKPTTGSSELWRSDGSVEGTFALAQATPEVLLPMNGGVVFWGGDDLHGREPWFSDGTLAGTRMIADVNPGSAGSYFSPDGALVSNGVFFFTAQISGHAKPWRSDGTAAGTRLITPDAVDPRAFTDVNGTIYFVSDLNDAAFDLWRTDGSNSGTVRVRHFEGLDRAPSLMWNVAGKLFFMLQRSGELWRSDGTSAGTVKVSKVPVPYCANVRDYAIMDGVLYWISGDPVFELWRSDGTEAGTYPANDVNVPTQQECASHPIIAVSKRLFFTAPDPVHGYELWTSDGTSSGTHILADLNPGPASSYQSWFGVIGTTLFLDSYDSVHGRELWAYSLVEQTRHRAVKTAAAGTPATTPFSMFDWRSTASAMPTIHPTPGTAPAR
jgi:ELWxxDGT repeat protein